MVEMTLLVNNVITLSISCFHFIRQCSLAQFLIIKQSSDRGEKTRNNAVILFFCFKLSDRIVPKVGGN